MRSFRRISLLFGLAIAVLVNLALIGLYVWSRDGQTTTVQVRNDGGAFRAFTDGKQVVPGGKDERDAAELNLPELGTIVLVVAPPAPALPGPAGIDSIVVTGPDGGLLFRDDFNEFDDEEVWEVLSGEFEVVDGVLTAKAIQGDNSIILREPGWSEYDVAVTYRNSRAGVIGMNITYDGGVFYHFDLLRDSPSYFSVHKGGIEQEGAEGSLMRTDYVGPLKSTAAMLTRVYPYLVVSLAIGTLLVLALSMADRLTVATSGLRFQLWRRQAAIQYVALAVLAVVAFGLALHLNQTYYDAIPHLPDEVSYLFQAHLLADLKVTDDIPPVREAFYFYEPPFLYENGDHWASFYPFGQPLVLAIGVLVGAQDYVPALVGAACVVLTFLIGRRLFDARTGFVAAALLAASPFFLMQASSYMSHNTATFYFLASLYFILNRDRPLLHGLLAGLFFGLAVNTRTLTAIALAPVYGVFMLSYLATKQEDWRVWLRHVAPFAMGGAFMAGAFLLYNHAITADAFTSAYTGTQGSGEELFGFRAGHHLDIGLRNVQAQLMALLLVFNAWPVWAALGLVMLPFLLGTREPRDYFLAACVLCTILLYVGYRYSGIYEGPRYWYETMPFLVLLSARGAAVAAQGMAAAAMWLRERSRWRSVRSDWAASAVVYTTLIALTVYGTGGWLFGWAEEQQVPLVPHEAAAMDGLFGVDDRLDALADEMALENALVLVRPCGFFDSFVCYGSVFLRNLPDYDGEVVWALFDEDLNADTMAAFPGRDVYVAIWDPVASIVPFTGD